MKSLRIFLFLFMLMALAAISKSTIFFNEDHEDNSNSDDVDPNQLEASSNSLRGTSRFLAERRLQAVMKCDNYPRICRAKGSPGPDCCKKKCVNVSTDRLNCGKCGNKCKFSETCCKGKCVNTMSDKKHCGGCNKKCKKGNACLYGMCSYA